MSRNAYDATARLHLVERIRDRVKRAMYRVFESDIDVSHDHIELRLHAAVELVLQEEVDQQREWLRQAEEIDRKEEAATAQEARR